MSTNTLQTLATGGRYFEGPRWHEGRWWVSDLYREAVFAYSLDGTEEEILSLAGDKPSGLGFLPDGSLLVVGQEARKVWRRSPAGEVTVHADLNSVATSDLNDMVVGTDGRAYVSAYGFDPFDGSEPALTDIFRVDVDGSYDVAASDLLFPNGLVLLPDGRLVVGETFANRFTSFAVGANGELTDRQVWAALGPPPESLTTTEELIAGAEVLLDGCCADQEGAIWVADAKNGRCIRVQEGGKIFDEIAVPDGLNVFACMLGGEDGRTLLFCVAPGLADNDRGFDASLRTAIVAVPHDGHP